MRKFYLLVLFVGIVIKAQTFPEPYCNIENGTIEEITQITLDDFPPIDNDDASSLLIDKTENEITIYPGESFTLTVKGNTYGAFDNSIVAFIDWNQNGVLDDENEVYELGLISNSTGSDNVSVSLDIITPENTLPGQTRIRITKVYTDSESIAVVDPCAISMSILDYGVFEGYGQAIDFTLLIGELGTQEVSTNQNAVYPNPTKGFFKVKSDALVKSMEVYDLSGKMILAQEVNKDNIEADISKFPSGTYILKLKLEDGKEDVLKLIKK